MTGKKKLGIIVIAIVVIILGLFLFVKIKDRGGVVVKATTDFPVNERLRAYRQDDDKWKDDKIGESKYTMGSSGCVITCISAALSNSTIAMEPGALNKFLGNRNVFDSEGNLQWGKIDEIDGLYADVYSDISSDIIDECLKAGHYPIVRIHRKSLVSYHHYVLIIGAENGEYICMDPLKSELTKLSDYSNKVYAIRCVYYEGRDYTDFEESE